VAGHHLGEIRDELRQQRGALDGGVSGRGVQQMVKRADNRCELMTGMAIADIGYSTTQL